jgi:hypothetical protein
MLIYYLLLMRIYSRSNSLHPWFSLELGAFDIRIPFSDYDLPLGFHTLVFCAVDQPYGRISKNISCSIQVVIPPSASPNPSATHTPNPTLSPWPTPRITPVSSSPASCSPSPTASALFSVTAFAASEIGFSDDFPSTISPFHSALLAVSPVFNPTRLWSSRPLGSSAGFRETSGFLDTHDLMSHNFGCSELTETVNLIPSSQFADSIFPFWTEMIGLSNGLMPSSAFSSSDFDSVSLNFFRCVTNVPSAPLVWSKNVIASETIGESNSLIETDIIEDSNKLIGTHSIDESEPLINTQPIEESNSFIETDTVGQSNNWTETDTIEKSNNMIDTHPIEESSNLIETETIGESNTVTDTNVIEGSINLTDTAAIERSKNLIETHSSRIKQFDRYC